MIMPFSKDNNEHDDAQALQEQHSAPPKMNPPSYEYATGSSDTGAAPQPANYTVPSESVFSPYPFKERQAPPPLGGTPVFYYENPRSGDRITTFLPPDHPEMICLQEGKHYTKSRFGVLGILAAIIWFPVGVICCMVDRRVECRRCGRVLDDGFYSC